MSKTFHSPRRSARAKLDQSRLALRVGSVEKRAMLIVHVQVRVKPECIEAFKQATLENARNSANEPGIASKRMTRAVSRWLKSIATQTRRRNTKRQRTTRNGATGWRR